jgi:hypothetical protein
MMQTLDATILYIFNRHPHAIGLDEKMRVVAQGQTICLGLRIETTPVDKVWVIA